jgi:hypothetical protein
MTFDDVRKIALLWPEVEDGTSYGTPALKVRKKMPGVPQDEREMLVESRPKVFYFTDHYRDYPMVLIRLSNATRTIVEPLLRRHWRTLASKKAIASLESNSHRHVWTAPSRQGLFVLRQRIGERSCIRPREAAIDRGP